MLAEPTLVLNRSWAAIATTTVRRALCLVYAGAARVICPETYYVHDFSSWADLKVLEGQRCIKTVSFEIRVPEVILLRAYDDFPAQAIVFSRKNLYRRDHYTCQYCGARPGSESLSIDHVVPRSRGGRTTWDNCVLACLRCNSRKADRTLDESRLALVRKPRRPSWAPLAALKLGPWRESWERFISDAYWNVELVD